jgi:peptidoglycan/xylan/chitin deacetylase (PgdA/CDA1 family)
LLAFALASSVAGAGDTVDRSARSEQARPDIGSGSAAPAHAEPPGRDDCWTQEALAAKPGEKTIRPQDRPIAPASAGLDPGRPIKGATGVIRRVTTDGGKRLVALTFDLCEAHFEITGYQGAIVDYLRERKIKATFFAGGKWLLNHPERAQQLMSDPLFEVANHGWEHRNLRLLSGATLREEIRQAELAYRDMRAQLQARNCLRDGVVAHTRAPARMNFFRFPFGACDERSLSAVAEQGLEAVQWDVSTGDSTQTAGEMLADVKRGVRPGSIVLMHANGRGKNTEDALPKIVAALERDNYTFVTISELLAAGKPDRTPSCYDARRGDTDRYDAHARKLLNIRLGAPLPAENVLQGE